MKVVCELSIVPLGTKSPSVSKYVAGVHRVLSKYNIRIQLTAMSTILEGELDEILEAVKEAHNSVFSDEVMRVVTTLKIDDRRDKEISIESKVDSVQKKI